jgi:hypothetical protein
MKRKHMALAALGLAALGGLLMLWRTSQPEAPDAPEAPGTATGAGGRGNPDAPVEHTAASGASGPAARSGGAIPRPELPLPGLGSADHSAPEGTAQMAPGNAARDDGAPAAGPRVYVRDDGALVRDHRTRDAPPMMSGTVRRPQRDVVKVEPTTVVAVRNAMRPIVYRCSAETPETSLGAEPRLQGRVVISITDGSLGVDDVVITAVDVQEPAASQLRECVSQDLKLVTLGIPGAADVTGHALTLPFRLRQ